MISPQELLKGVTNRSYLNMPGIRQLRKEITVDRKELTSVPALHRMDLAGKNPPV
jgi:hypothetical protein